MGTPSLLSLFLSLVLTLMQPTTVSVRGDVKCVTKIVEYMRTKLKRKIRLQRKIEWIIRMKSIQTHSHAY